MPFRNPSDDAIRHLLSRRLTIAVVGCSPDPARDSHRIARLLIERGHRVIPVNPLVEEILGQRSYDSLRAVPERVDMVDVFRRSETLNPIFDDAIAIRASVIWTQLGVGDEAAAARALHAGLQVIMDRCPAIEYRRLFTE